MANSVNVIRHLIGDYLDVSGTSGTSDYQKMCNGFTQINESPNAQTDTKQYVCDTSASSQVVSYQVEFPFTADIILNEDDGTPLNMGVIDFIYDIATRQRTGDKATANYVRVELWRSVDEDIYVARKYKVAITVSSIEGDGGQQTTMSGTLQNVGSMEEGTFNIDTMEFTPIEVTG